MTRRAAMITVLLFVLSISLTAFLSAEQNTAPGWAEKRIQVLESELRQLRSGAPPSLPTYIASSQCPPVSAACSAPSAPYWQTPVATVVTAIPKNWQRLELNGAVYILIPTGEPAAPAVPTYIGPPISPPADPSVTAPAATPVQ